MKAFPISISLTEDEKAELDKLVEHSGLSRSDYIKSCALPSKGSPVIFLDGAAILAQLAELYNIISRSPPDTTSDLSAALTSLFAKFDELMAKIGGD